MAKPLQYIVDEWKETYGEEKVPESGVRYKFIPKETRQDLMEILVETVVKEGLAKSRGYFTVNQHERIIVEACVNTNSKYKDSIKRMSKAAKDDLKKAVTRVYMRLNPDEDFGEEDTVVQSKLPEDVFTPEPLVETPKNQASEEPSSSDEDDQTLSEHQLRLLNKKPVASTAPVEDLPAPKLRLNNEIDKFLGIDVKEWGYSDE